MSDPPSKSGRSKVRGSAPTMLAPQFPRKKRLRGDEPTLMAPAATVLYRAVDESELSRIQQLEHKRFAPMQGAETIQILCDEQHARAIAGPGWVTRFAVQNNLLSKYARTGAKPREEYRIPAPDVEALNDALVGPIVVLR